MTKQELIEERERIKDAHRRHWDLSIKYSNMLLNVNDQIANAPDKPFKFGDRVLVSDSGDKWRKAFYLQPSACKNHSHWIILGKGRVPMEWMQCKPDPDYRVLEFIEHDGGECPVAETDWVFIKTTEVTSIQQFEAGQVDWGHNFNNKVEYYTLVPDWMK